MQIKERLTHNKALRLSTNFFITSTDYGRPVRKSPSLYTRKSNPNPKFLATAEGYFVCHIGPKFHISFEGILHWVSVVRDQKHTFALQESYFKNPELLATFHGFGE
jgi:hypothetical protein